jgi:hypothetical protein
MIVASIPLGWGPWLFLWQCLLLPANKFNYHFQFISCPARILVPETFWTRVSLDHNPVTSRALKITS